MKFFKAEATEFKGVATDMLTENGRQRVAFRDVFGDVISHEDICEAFGLHFDKKAHPDVGFIPIDEVPEFDGDYEEEIIDRIDKYGTASWSDADEKLLEEDMNQQQGSCNCETKDETAPATIEPIVNINGVPLNVYLEKKEQIEIDILYQEYEEYYKMREMDSIESVYEATEENLSAGIDAEDCNMKNPCCYYPTLDNSDELDADLDANASVRNLRTWNRKNHPSSSAHLARKLIIRHRKREPGRIFPPKRSAQKPTYKNVRSV